MARVAEFANSCEASRKSSGRGFSMLCCCCAVKRSLTGQGFCLAISLALSSGRLLVWWLLRTESFNHRRSDCRSIIKPFKGTLV
jgi:hypothetical protein